MNRITKALPIIMLLGVFACNNSVVQDDTGAVDSAEALLVLVDEGKYSDSWKDSNLKKVVTQEVWETFLTDNRKPLGKVLSRSLRTKSRSTSVPGLPDGEYVMIQYETDFENKHSALETIAVMHEKDGTWRVSGFDFKMIK